GLPIRPVRTSRIWPLFPVEAEPPQVALDAGLRLRSGSLDVGVFDTQNERAPRAAREQPVEERRASVADVEMSRGTRSEANAHHQWSVASDQWSVDQLRIGKPIAAHCPLYKGYRKRKSATACAAIASPRPTASSPSFVLPFTLTRAASTPIA